MGIIYPMGGGNIRKFILRDIEVPFNLPQLYDIVFCFEVIEHVDKTDILLENCYNNLKDDGIFMIAVPNLSSIYSRIELMLGFQPHITEISNIKANFGTGIFGKINNPHDAPIHHIRGITYGGMKEMLKFYNFRIIKTYNASKGAFFLRLLPSSLASVVLFVCKKQKN
ncbi:class I SAM-dependent methyltransferase [Treponema sp. R80B11-R83G3]